MATQNAEAIAQIKVFVAELRRIALLWDEQWLGGLEQLISNLMKRMAQVINYLVNVISSIVLSRFILTMDLVSLLQG